ncbi:MAG: TetR/AcrR family transcriptional regulator [Gordonia sp. (in: high G+C Gram-positive bacteria)]|uniref:TetR/AcrR family transcriptional regulator n=1 Tax=Gordonia sp. (in: high G+C Gram-positive bacteria) TaxID=84139 RepID=UPI0039E439DA
MFSEHVQSPRAEQRELTRTRVITCAQRLFVERCFAGTTIRAIAENAQVSVGTVMAVGDKDTLLLAAYDRWIGEIHVGRPGPPDGSDPAVRIGDCVQPFLDLFARDLPLSREYGAVLARGTHRTAVFAGLATTLMTEFTEVFEDAGLGDDAVPAARAAYLSHSACSWRRPGSAPT